MHDSEVSQAMAFLAALGRHEFNGAGAMLDEEAVVELPYAGEGITLNGRAEAMAFFRRTMGQSAAHIEYRLDQAYPSRQAKALVLEISTQGRTQAGRDYTNRLVAVFRFRKGRIVLFREYFNPGRVG